MNPSLETFELSLILWKYLEESVILYINCYMIV